MHFYAKYWILVYGCVSACDLFYINHLVLIVVSIINFVVKFGHHALCWGSSWGIIFNIFIFLEIFWSYITWWRNISVIFNEWIQESRLMEKIKLEDYTKRIEVSFRSLLHLLKAIFAIFLTKSICILNTSLGCKWIVEIHFRICIRIYLNQSYTDWKYIW